MNTEKRDFDKEAGKWDDKPARVKLAKDIAQSISRRGILKPDMDIMDFGCGTGLLAVHLQPLVRSITAVDSSQGMLDVFKGKIEQMNLTNVETRHLDLDKGDMLEGVYDLVLSNMTLHHVKNISLLFRQFHGVMKAGGYLCVSDLDLDRGRFHDDNTGVFHFGFDRQALRKVFEEAGFDYVKDEVAAEVVKPGADGEINRFTVFLMIGRKRAD